MKQSPKQALSFHLMCANKPLSAQELAALLGVTPRSIRNYINELNAGVEPLVLSSRQGYRWNHQSANILPYQSDEHNKPSTPWYRSLYILRKLLFYRSITKQQIIEALHISDSTCESDLIRVKSTLKEYGLRLVTQRDTLSIAGMEFDCRRLAVDCILNTKGDRSPFFSYIRNAYAEYDMNFIKNTILSVMMEHGLELNGFALNNILLYIGVGLVNFHRGHPLTEGGIRHLLMDKHPDFLALCCCIFAIRAFYS